jgi:hypothetical protein
MTVITPEPFSGIMGGAWDYKASPFQTHELARVNNQALLDQARIQAANQIDVVNAQGANLRETNRQTALLNRRANARANLFNLGSAFANLGGVRKAGSSDIQERLLALGAPVSVNDQLASAYTTMTGLRGLQGEMTSWDSRSDAAVSAALSNGLFQ